MHPEATRSATGSTLSPLTPAAGPLPAAIGDYRILGLLGAGGMGVVYEAEQERPRRTVALKVIHPELASPERLRRFARESAVLARLQHPGIAQVYEAGTAEGPEGAQPYFAMELVRGATLGAYAEHGASDAERLELFAKVCDAVHHAHQHGVIHRDLKPANILVDRHGQPKVLDFGVARLTDTDDRGAGPRTTALGEVVGTLQYMSPEQLSGDPLEVDTRSDIYALGLILYELLAGRRPYEVAGRHLYDALRVIVNEDPPTLGSIDRRLRGDVETIVAKALEKDRARRYASAAELAADVRRHLRDEPISARPASAAYQLAKFARRHRGLVAGLAAAALALVAGSVVSALLAVRARAAERAAETRRAEAVAAQRLADRRREEAETAQSLADRRRTEAEDARAAAERERLAAQASAAEARREARKSSAVNAFLIDMLGAADVERVLGRQLTVKDLVDQAGAKLQSGALASEPAVRADVHRTLGRTYWSTAAYDSALRHLDSARALFQRTPGVPRASVVESMLDLAMVHSSRGDFVAHARVAREALREARALRPSRPDFVVSALQRVANAEDRAGHGAAAESLATEALALARRSFPADSSVVVSAMTGLATMRDFRGRFREAEPLWRDALAAERRLRGDRDPATLMAIGGLAFNLARQGKAAEAESLLRPAVPDFRRIYGESHPMTVTILERLGDALSRQGKRAEAEPILREVLATRLRVLGERHADVAFVRTTLAALLASTGRHAEAETLYSQALAGRTALLGPRHPAVASSMTDLASLASARGDVREAERRYRESIPIWREARIARQELSSLASLADLLTRTGRAPEGEALLREAMPRLLPEVGDSSTQAASARYALAAAVATAGRLAEADSLHRVALDLRRRVYGARSAQAARSLAALAAVRAQRGDMAASEPLLAEAVEVTRALAPAADPTLLGYLARLAEARCATGKGTAGEADARAVLAAAAPADSATQARARAALAACRPR